jgi:two-component system cell cycle sensor histidine kinase/response regulator CckA
MDHTPDSELICEGARMKDQYKTKKQLIEELEVLRNQLAEPKKIKADRKPVEETLLESEENFRALAENAYDAIFITIGEGLQAYANKRASEITGYSVAELLKSSIKDLVHPDELGKIMERYKKRLAGELIPHQYETIIIRKDGKSLPIELTAAKTIWQGQPAALVIIRDITERKQSEEALRENEERFRIVLESSMDNLYRRNLKTNTYDYISPAVERISGYSVEEMFSMPLESVVSMMHPDDIGKVKSVIGESMTSDRATYLLEYRFRHKDGQYRWLSDLFTVARDAQGSPLYFVGDVRDITERKQMEEALKESQETINAIIETSQDWIWTIDHKGIHTYSNPAIKKILGYGPEEIVDYSSFDLMHEDDKGMVKSILRECQEKRCGWNNLLLRWRHKDGTYRYLESNAVPILNSKGDLIGFRGVDRDITERKQAEDALRESEERYRAVIESQIDLISRYLPDTTLTFVNDAYCQFYGKTREELIGHSFLPMIAPEFHELVKKETENLAKNPRPLAGEYLNYRHDGTECWIQWVVQCIVGEDGRVVELQAVGRDITEHKRAEKKLHESKKFLQDIFDGIQDGISVLDRNLTITQVNKWIEKMHLKDMPLIGKKCYEVYQKRKTVCPWCPSTKALSTGKVHVEEVRVPLDDDSFWWCELSAYPLRGVNDDVGGVIEHVKNITERKQAEEKLRESESRYRTLFDSASDAIFILDPTTAQFLDVNQVACERLDYSREELVQMTAPDIDSPEYAPLVRERIETLRQLGHVFFETAHVRRDGTIIPTELSSQIITYAGKPAVLSIARDITERKQADARAEHLKFVLLAIRGVNQLLTREKDRDRLIQSACDKLIETRGYDNVWITLIDGSGKVAATAEAGLGKRFLPLVEQLGRSEPPHCMRMALTQADVLIIDDPLAICTDCPLSNGYGGRRAMATRLEHGGKIYGLMTVSVSGNYAADEEEQTLFAEVAEDIAFALYSIELEEKRWQAEVTVLESEERFRKLVETMKVGLSTIDEKGVLTYVNEYFSTMLGYTIDEMIGRSTLDFYYDEEGRKAQEEIFEKRKVGMQDPTPYEVIWRKKDGQKVYSILSPTPIFDANGRYTGSFAIHTDITERKQAEELLRKEKEISLSILENAPYGVALIDKGGKYIYINSEFTNITGYTLEDIPTGKDWFQKAFSDPKERERFIQVWKEDRSKGKMMNREFGIHCKDEKIREIDIRSTFLKDGRAVVVLHDITEQKLAEERMESLQEQLRQSQKMEAIGRLAGGIAHDFNNLLTIIKGYSQLSLIELKEDSPLKKNIEHIHGATDRAANLVRQLLAFSRRQILEMKVLNLNAILTNLDNMLRRVIGEDIELITILAEDLGRVKTDPGWIEQAIMNLVVNSRDAMPSGGKLTIETGNADLDEASTFGHVGVEPGRYVMLSVSDTGIGITPEVMERLFEPFFSTKEKDKGTGLGLSTVYGIVKQSDGDIWVYSEPGKGATFKIYLPRVDEPLEERKEKVLGDELLRGSETILLVEDEENVRKLALRVLERQGYKVLSARDGDDALLICEQFKDPIHLMLTDVVMPGMSGHELAKRLKSLYPKMKILYMSGYTDDTIVLHGVLLEGVNYIQKPFTVDALTKKVREVLEQ